MTERYFILMINNIEDIKKQTGNIDMNDYGYESIDNLMKYNSNNLFDSDIIVTVIL